MSISVDSLPEILNKTPPFVAALLNSGLLGHTENGAVDEEAVAQFQAYGTQWRESLGERTFGDAIEKIRETYPIIRPTLTRGLGEISPENVDASGDFGWIAQHYLVPNKFYFVPPQSTSRQGGPGLRLNTMKLIERENNPVFLCPNAAGELAMVMVWSDRDTRSKFPEAALISAELVNEVLAQLSYVYDKPLAVSHTLFVGIPSGAIHFEFFGEQPDSQIDDFVFDAALPKGVLRAKSLYREALSSSDVFYKFLCLWKSYEVATQCRNDIREKIRGNRNDNRSDVVMIKEVIPSNFAFEGFVDKKFDDVKNKCRGAFRNAIAHVTLEAGKAKFADSAKDYYDVWHILPVFCYMARIRILNAEQTVRANSRA